MDIEELRQMLERERTHETLQPLPQDFYQEAGVMLATLRASRESEVETAEDPLESTEIQHLSRDIEAIRRIVSGIHERRVAKILRHAQQETSVPDSNLTAEELALKESINSVLTEVNDEVLKQTGILDNQNSSNEV